MKSLVKDSLYGYCERDWKQNTKIIKILQKQVENSKFYCIIKISSFFNSIFINFNGNPENFQAQVIEKKKTIKYNGG